MTEPPDEVITCGVCVGPTCQMLLFNIGLLPFLPLSLSLPPLSLPPLPLYLLYLSPSSPLPQVALARAKQQLKSAMMMNLESRLIVFEDIGR